LQDSSSPQHSFSYDYLQVQEAFSRRSESAEAKYTRLVQDFLALCIRDYVDFAYPSNRSTLEDWWAYDTAAGFIFGNQRCAIVHPETLIPMNVSDMVPLVSLKNNAVSTLKTKVILMAKKKKVSHTKPAFTPPSRFTDDNGESWEILEDPRETAAYVNSETKQIHVSDTTSPKLFIMALLQMANAELDLNLDPEDLDSAGEKLHSVLECNKFFRVRVVANVEMKNE